MIVVRVELWSAITKAKTELARLHICNTGESAGTRRNYTGTSFRGRSTQALDRATPSKTGTVANWPSEQLHVWNLVAAMLADMGYGTRQHGSVARLIDAAIALAWSEVGTEAKLLNEPGADRMFEPWPAMDRLCEALDVMRPGWRDQRPAPPLSRTASPEQASTTVGD